MRNAILFAMALAVVASSCSKSTNLEYNNQTKAPLSIEFDNIAGGANLQLNTATYINASNENFSVTKMKYYVSNFRLTNTDGSVYTVPQDSCYFLIDEAVTGVKNPMIMVPEGEYKTLSFMIGVDSLRNTMDVSRRTGVLDPIGPASEMYWGWNSGYIFLKLEGTSPAISTAGNIFRYHVGGFGGYSNPTPNNLRTISLDLTARGTPKVKSGRQANIHLFVDALKILNGTTNMSFGALSMIHAPLPAVPLANNYISMFSHDHTEN